LFLTASVLFFEPHGGNAVMKTCLPA